jgi:outer membrane lipoprotein LolB
VKLLAIAACTAALCIFFFLTGCAIPISTDNSSQSNNSLWRGRLAVRIASEPAQVELQSLSAGFELSGNPQIGRLILYTPLGTTAAALSWNSQDAILQSNGVNRNFESLNALIKETLGTEIPVAALFAWLAGDELPMTGWSVDLSQHATGRITARRSAPEPAAELRLIMEK